jgi:hypothetical protein
MTSREKHFRLIESAKALEAPASGPGTRHFQIGICSPWATSELAEQPAPYSATWLGSTSGRSMSVNIATSLENGLTGEACRRAQPSQVCTRIAGRFFRLTAGINLAGDTSTALAISLLARSFLLIFLDGSSHLRLSFEDSERLALEAQSRHSATSTRLLSPDGQACSVGYWRVR